MSFPLVGNLTAVDKKDSGQAGVTGHGRAGITGMQCGFPIRRLKEFKGKALNAGVPYVVVGERGYYPSGLKKRMITEIYKPLRRDL
ncbi:MAG: hypothetical protein HY808_08440 [Nitrospirae bacterium]|nr:hypothetical protein [Nitrospirota bacterium]